MRKFELAENEKNVRNSLHHRGEIVVVDEVLECNETGILTQSVIKPENPFLKEIGGEWVFPLYQSIELIAQSLGCYQKLADKYSSLQDKDQKPKIGFLLSARNFEIFKPFAKIGQLLLVQVQINTRDENGFGVCEGRVYFDCLDESSLACRSSVSVLSPQGDIKDFLKEKE